MHLMEPQLIALPRSTHDLGILFFAQADLPLPFELRRAYFVCGIPEGARRGGHSHREGTELLMALQGSVTLRLIDAIGQEVIFHLDEPGTGAIIPPDWWVDLRDYAENTITLVLSSVEFFEENYIREPELFFKGVIPPDVVSRSKI